MRLPVVSFKQPSIWDWGSAPVQSSRLYNSSLRLLLAPDIDKSLEVTWVSANLTEKNVTLLLSLEASNTAVKLHMSDIFAHNLSVISAEEVDPTFTMSAQAVRNRQKWHTDPADEPAASLEQPCLVQAAHGYLLNIAAHDWCSLLLVVQPHSSPS